MKDVTIDMKYMANRVNQLLLCITELRAENKRLKDNIWFYDYPELGGAGRKISLQHIEDEFRKVRQELCDLTKQHMQLTAVHDKLREDYEAKSTTRDGYTEGGNDVRLVITHKGSPIYHYSKRDKGPLSTTVDLDEILNTTRRETRKEVMGELSEKLAKKLKPIVYHDNLSDCGSCVDRKDLIELGLL